MLGLFFWDTAEAPEPYIQEGHVPLHFSSVGAHRGTGLEQLKMPSGKLLAFFDEHSSNFTS